jgi:hypothetical protein
MQIGQYLWTTVNVALYSKWINQKDSRSTQALTLLEDGVWQIRKNADNVLSRTGFVICYANCPIIWCSKQQTENALSMAEAEYIAMSNALCETILIQNLIKKRSVVFFTC